MDMGLFAPLIARAIIDHLENVGAETINVLFCAKNNTCEEVVKRSVDGVITINVSRRAVKNLRIGELDITMDLAFDGVSYNVAFMPEDLLGVMIPIPGTDKLWCYMLNDVDQQLRLLSGASYKTSCSACLVKSDDKET